MLNVIASSDGINPIIWTIPEGVSVTIDDPDEVTTLDGPFDGPWPTNPDDEEGN